jgi:hypothetical protein
MDLSSNMRDAIKDQLENKYIRLTAKELEILFKEKKITLLRVESLRELKLGDRIEYNDLTFQLNAGNFHWSYINLDFMEWDRV